MMLAAYTPPHACYASIASYYATHRERGRFHTQVITDGAYALVDWYGFHSGGEGAFVRRGGRWCVLVNGGGAMNADDMVHYGVPRATAERLLARMHKLHP